MLEKINHELILIDYQLLLIKRDEIKAEFEAENQNKLKGIIKL